MKPTVNYSCAKCGYSKPGQVVSLPFFDRQGKRQAICHSCTAEAVGQLQNAVYEHRPTKTDMEQAIKQALRPYAERISALESEVAALRNVIDGRTRMGVLPYAKSKTEAARELLRAGKPNKEVSATLGLTPQRVKVIKCRMDKPRISEKLTGWARLRAELLAERGDACQMCGAGLTRLRRITFERGEHPLKEDVKFLCEGCHGALKPIPFYDEFLRRQAAAPPEALDPETEALFEGFAEEANSQV